jgi:primosomal protein N' (replication factor Y)
MDPKYHARDIARYRCAKQNAVMLLSSATPSLESYLKAKEGKYTLVTLPERYGKSVLPETVITDMRKDARNGYTSPIGTELRQRLGEVLERKEQAILFINQRGYNRFLSCPLCGHVLTCEHCSVSYTYHTTTYGRGYLYCHYCGSKEFAPNKCPQCGNEVLRHIGYGTQMVEEELNKLFPSARVTRMDADTTSTKFSYENLLGSFRDGESDILIGTQMVTKGHDFPNVTLVGVINADSSLYLNDYKANERTFSLITQVIGRAGRADRKGCAMVQTTNPEHPILRISADQDYEKMYENEIALRSSLVFPPYCDMVLFTFASASEHELVTGATQFTETFKKLKAEKYDGVASVVFGPMEAPIYKINGVYRMRVVVKTKLNASARKLISEAYSEISKTLGKRISISVDVNPTNL